MKSIKVDNNLGLLDAQGIAGVIEVRCPAGLSVMTLADAYTLMTNIKRELISAEFMPLELVRNIIDDELSGSLDKLRNSIKWGSDWAPGDTYVIEPKKP